MVAALRAIVEHFDQTYILAAPRRDADPAVQSGIETVEAYALGGYGGRTSRSVAKPQTGGLGRREASFRQIEYPRFNVTGRRSRPSLRP